jgi:hypothetical protein
MYLHLLEFTYAVADREGVETWLSQADLGGAALISIKQYDDEILAVLASYQALVEEHKKLQQHPAISSCVAKQCTVYRITTTTAPASALSSFPLREEEEWYQGAQKTAYLCVQSHQLSEEQTSWLATNADIIAWEDLFELPPLASEKFSAFRHHAS